MKKLFREGIREGMRYFSRGEKALWSGSCAVILLSFALFDQESLLTLAASLVGVTALIFNAKGNPAGQALMILFSLLYGVISYTFAYYGEMITYLGMTMPMAVCALIAWLRHPYGGSRAQVAVGRIGKKETAVMWGLALAVTAAFYFILRWFDTANLPLSTLSVMTSFLAVYLTFRRCASYAAAYAANDAVLIALWVLASREDARYLSMVVCFAAFGVNDLYGFISWRAREKQQKAAADPS